MTLFDPDPRRYMQPSESYGGGSAGPLPRAANDPPVQPPRLNAGGGGGGAGDRLYPSGPGMPEELGGYKVVRQLGQGGMGQVFLGFDKNLERHVALKVMLEALVHDPVQSERLMREARAAAQLVHPSIVTVHSLGQHDGRIFFVMEYVEGQSLSSLVRERGTLPVAEALEFTRQAAEGLGYAWERGIVHRDIKPANLMITREMRLKIADFGLAKQVHSDLSLTQTGLTVGSPYYMAPEQALGKQVDFRADIYSLGCTLYVMLTGTVPFDGSTPLGIMMRHTKDPLPNPPEIARLLNGRVTNLLSWMMAKSLADRPPSYAALLKELSALIDAANGVAPLRPSGVPLASETQGLASTPDQPTTMIGGMKPNPNPAPGGDVATGGVVVGGVSLGAQPPTMMLPQPQSQPGQVPPGMVPGSGTPYAGSQAPQPVSSSVTVAPGQYITTSGPMPVQTITVQTTGGGKSTWFLAAGIALGILATAGAGFFLMNQREAGGAGRANPATAIADSAAAPATKVAQPGPATQGSGPLSRSNPGAPAGGANALAEVQSEPLPDSAKSLPIFMQKALEQAQKLKIARTLHTSFRQWDFRSAQSDATMALGTPTLREEAKVTMQDLADAARELEILRQEFVRTMRSNRWNAGTHEFEGEKVQFTDIQPMGLVVKSASDGTEQIRYFPDLPGRDLIVMFKRAFGDDETRWPNGQRPAGTRAEEARDFRYLLLGVLLRDPELATELAKFRQTYASSPKLADYERIHTHFWALMSAPEYYESMRPDIPGATAGPGSGRFTGPGGLRGRRFLQQGLRNPQGGQNPGAGPGEGPDGAPPNPPDTDQMENEGEPPQQQPGSGRPMRPRQGGGRPGQQQGGAPPEGGGPGKQRQQ